MNEGNDEGIWHKLAPCAPLPPPPLPPTIFNRALNYICSYFKTSPDIIEYADAEIERKAQVRIKARKGFVSGAKAKHPIVRVVAILTDVGPVGADGGCEVIERPVEL